MYFSIEPLTTLAALSNNTKIQPANKSEGLDNSYVCTPCYEKKNFLYYYYYYYYPWSIRVLNTRKGSQNHLNTWTIPESLSKGSFSDNLPTLCVQTNKNLRKMLIPGIPPHTTYNTHYIPGNNVSHVITHDWWWQRGPGIMKIKVRSSKGTYRVVKSFNNKLINTKKLYMMCF